MPQGDNGSQPDLAPELGADGLRTYVTALPNGSHLLCVPSSTKNPVEGQPSPQRTLRQAVR